ncbi:MAG: DUF1467 family protein [Alphaproteobacteria bacterium]
MTIFTGIMVYVIIWWLVFFMLLPIGVKTLPEMGEEVEAGNATSAPANPNLKKKVLAATLIAAVLFGFYFWLQGSGLISLRPDFQAEG